MLCDGRVGRMPDISSKGWWVRHGESHGSAILVPAPLETFTMAQALRHTFESVFSSSCISRDMMCAWSKLIPMPCTKTVTSPIPLFLTQHSAQ